MLDMSQSSNMCLPISTPRADVVDALKLLSPNAKTIPSSFVGSEKNAVGELEWLVGRLDKHRPLGALQEKLTALLGGDPTAPKLTTLEARTVACLNNCPIVMNRLSATLKQALENFYVTYGLEEPLESSPAVVARVRLDRLSTESVYRGLRKQIHPIALAGRILRLLAVRVVGALPKLRAGHVNFRLYRQGGVDLVGVADSGYYRKEGMLGLDYMHVVRHSIDTECLWPTAIDASVSKQARDSFFEHLISIALNKQRENIRFGVGLLWILEWGLQLVGAPGKKRAISLDGAPSLVCCQFVLYVMVEAVRRVYKERGWEEPDPWHLFGLGDTLDLDHLLPTEFFERLTEQGILKPLQPDPNAVIV